MNNANDVKHTATLVLLNMAERYEQAAAALVAKHGEPRMSPRHHPAARVWRDISIYREDARRMRHAAEAPERGLFEEQRKYVEALSATRGVPLKIGEPNRALDKAIEQLAKVRSALEQMEPLNKGTPPPNKTNNCDCADCATE